MRKITLQGFGNRLRSERQRLGLNQVEFAERAGIKRPTLYLYENDETVPNLKFLESLQSAGIDIDYLLFGVHANHIQTEGRICLAPSLLSDIFKVVDEVGRDDNGNLLSMDTRRDFFAVLCASYTNKEDQKLDLGVVQMMLNHKKE